MFRRAVLASEMLLDVTAKAAYDKVLKARHAARVRVEKMDAQHRKAREDLEAREQAHKRSKTAEEDAQRDLQAQIRRLREESARKLQEEEDRFRELLRQARAQGGGKDAAAGAGMAEGSDYSEDFEAHVPARMHQHAKHRRERAQVSDIGIVGGRCLVALDVSEQLFQLAHLFTWCRCISYSVHVMA